MARIAYDAAAAAAFQASRELPPDGLSLWQAAIARHLAPRPGMRVLDLGAGTGRWATVLASWYGISVVAVEPSAAMRARSRCECMLAGHAAAVPLGAATMGGAWLSTVIHHLPDLPAAARELRRVLRPGAPVLIRSAFPGRYHGIGLFRFWPEAIAVLDTFPSVASVRTVFAAEGFSYVDLEPVRQLTAPSLAAIAATARRESHTPLTLISDSAYEAGLARLRAAAAIEHGPVIDTLDLLVLRSASERGKRLTAHRWNNSPPSSSPGRLGIPASIANAACLVGANLRRHERLPVRHSQVRSAACSGDQNGGELTKV
jgi:ubiquinone/menaquinone biosynthesis C-methylase UbiE